MCERERECIRARCFVVVVVVLFYVYVFVFVCLFVFEIRDTSLNRIRPPLQKMVTTLFRRAQGWDESNTARGYTADGWGLPSLHTCVSLTRLSLISLLGFLVDKTVSV